MGGSTARSMLKAVRISRPVRAGWDVGKTTSENRNHWRYAGEWLSSADGVASTEERRTIRSRARMEVANNSYARGMIDTLANDIIGTGPRLQLLTADNGLNQCVEAAFAEWADRCRLAEKLRTAIMARKQDGEVFLSILRLEAGMDVQVIEADRVTSPDVVIDDPLNVDGVLLDPHGRPRGYQVLKDHPGDSYAWRGRYETLPADSVIHLFCPKRPGQHRGYSEIAPALPLFGMLRRFTLAVLGAAEGAANYAGIMYTTLPPEPPKPGHSDEEEEEGFTVRPMEELELRRNMMLSLPAGWEFSQLKPEQPAATYSEFKREVLNEAARCLGLPLNIALGNSSRYNYASGRLDWQGYFKGIRVEQHGLGVGALDPILRAFLEWFGTVAHSREMIGLLSMPIIPRQWFWDGFEHIDPLKDANALWKRLVAGATSYPEVYAQRGKDYFVEMSEQAKALGLTLKQYQRCLVNALFRSGGSGQPVEEDPEEDDPDADDPDAPEDGEPEDGEDDFDDSEGHRHGAEPRGRQAHRHERGNRRAGRRRRRS